MKIKLNTTPSKLETLAQRLKRALAKIPEPAPIYVVYRYEPIEGSMLIAAFRDRKLAEESAARIRSALSVNSFPDVVAVKTVPVKG